MKETAGTAHLAARQVLLTYGIVSSLLNVAMNIIGAIEFEGYSSMSQTVSELSAPRRGRSGLLLVSPTTCS